ncbi:hypothetical protein [Microcella alkalica]|uniref:luciferase domain-containing protein n=1 Tax=Microcella alkalica TaxID=355930 RepID=UPI0015FB6710|nr:hypothetical protein [Microcella alkalica]
MMGALLVQRTGRPPMMALDGPAWQLDQRSVPTTWVAVWDALRSGPGVIAGPSALGAPGSRAVLVPSVINPEPGTSLAPGGHALEPAHLHSPADTSMHVVLPAERAALVVAQGWGIACPRAVHGTEVILFGPRDEAELDVVSALARESVRWSLARNGVTVFQRRAPAPDGSVAEVGAAVLATAALLAASVVGDELADAEEQRAG